MSGPLNGTFVAGQARPTGQTAVDLRAIVATGLRRDFGGKTAVDGIDLSIDAGAIYGFLGPNGAGKTTTVRMLCTLLRPTGGTATVGGYDVAADPQTVRSRIGVALQEASLDLGQTGRELLDLQARLFHLPRDVAHKRIAELIALVDLGDAIDRRVKTYSGGMRRRLDLALALVHDPQILFLDEPTTGLDPTSRRQVWSEVRRLNAQRGLTIFLTTQYLEEADELAERVGIIVDGRIAVEGTPAELKRRVGKDVIAIRLVGLPHRAANVLAGVNGVEHVDVAQGEVRVIVDDGPAAITPVAAALSRVDGVVVQEMTIRQPTLDDVFLEVTGRRMTDGNGSRQAA